MIVMRGQMHLSLNRGPGKKPETHFPHGEIVIIFHRNFFT
jgi:hypothetical protein